MANSNNSVWKYIATAAVSVLMGVAATIYADSDRLSVTQANEVREIINNHPTIARIDERLKHIEESLHRVEKAITP